MCLIYLFFAQATEIVTPDQLRAAKVPIFNHEKCKNDYQSYNIITDRMICAGFKNGGVDSCGGDSGGPLVNTDDGRQVGIVSFGNDCALPNYPGVYARIASARQWIKEQTGI